MARYFYNDLKRLEGYNKLCEVVAFLRTVSVFTKNVLKDLRIYMLIFFISVFKVFMWSHLT